MHRKPVLGDATLVDEGDGFGDGAVDVSPGGLDDASSWVGKRSKGVREQVLMVGAGRIRALVDNLTPSYSVSRLLIGKG